MQRVGRDRVELGVMGAFAALSLWVLALDLWQVIAHNWDWTGTDGLFLVDQMGYLAWIQEGSRHLLVSNLFMIGHSPADLFEPLTAISGGLSAVGFAPWLALLLWKPVAIGGLMLATRAYVHRTLPSPGARRSALALGLFCIGPGALVAERIAHADLATRLQLSAITKDLWLGFWSWGYPLGLIALALILAAILAYARDRTAPRTGWWAPVLGALASLVHPWQGAILILVLAGSEGLARAGGAPPAWRALLRTCGATSVPLLYFVILNRVDPSWKLAQQSATGSFPLWMVAVSLAPLALPAALAYRIRPRTFLGAATRLWPPAALALFLFSETRLGGVPTHAFLGISIPLAVLAVEGVRSVSWRPGPRRIALALGTAIGLAVIAALGNQLIEAHRLLSPGPVHGQASGPGDANFIQAGERSALEYLAHDPRPGGVLSRFYLGTVVPGITGRQIYVGNPYYSPAYLSRISAADGLFLGGLGPRQARSLVQASGARFVLADCRSAPGLAAELAPISGSVRRFGCAAVIELRR